MAGPRVQLISVWRGPGRPEGSRGRCATMDAASRQQPTGATVTVIGPSKAQRDGLFGAMIAIFLLAMVRGITGAAGGGGRIAVIVFTCAVIALLLWGWIWAIRHPGHLEISPAAVTLVEHNGRRRTLARESGDEIRVTLLGGGRYRRSALTIDGSGTAIPVSFFSLAEIERQCVADGWRFARRGRRAVR